MARCRITLNMCAERRMDELLEQESHYGFDCNKQAEVRPRARLD